MSFHDHRRFVIAVKLNQAERLPMAQAVHRLIRLEASKPEKARMELCGL